MSAIYQFFEAIVTRNDDPEKRGRVRVTCGALAGNEELERWVEPTFPTAGKQHGWFYVPQPGDVVTLRVYIGDTEDEVIGMGFLQDPDYTYVAALQPTPDRIHNAFKANYPKRFGYISPQGLMLLFDDQDVKIYLGSDKADEPFVLGKVFQKLMQDLLDAIVAHTHIAPGGSTGPPENITAFQSLRASPVDDGAVLSDKIVGEK